MRLTVFTDYALRVLTFVASTPGECATIAQVATAHGISRNHLAKVVHRLGQAGVLANTRGRGGGLSLARAASSIRLGEVVCAMEGRAVPAECFGPGARRCVIEPACRLRGVFAEALEAFYATLDRYTVADLVARRAEIVAVVHAHTRAA